MLMKKIFLLFIIAFLGMATANAELILGKWTDHVLTDASAKFSGGSGTASDPYLIATAYDLAQIAINVNSETTKYSKIYFRQTADIDLAGRYWIPIADGKEEISQSFQGYYDGDYHVVKNMYIKSSECYTARRGFLGLFAWLGKGSLKHLGVVDGYILIDNNRDEQAALLLGYADQSKVDRCFATGRIEATATAGVEIGGLVGQNFSGGEITNCYFIGELESGEIKTMAGLMPYQRDKLQNCYAAAKVKTEARTHYAIAQDNVNCFYNKILNPAYTTGKGTGVTTDEMKSSAMATQLGEAFAQNDDINNGYPYLVGFEKALPSSVESVKMADIRVSNGRVSSDEDFRIYNLVGVDVTPQNGSLKGVYVVKTNGKAQKIVIR